MAALRMGELSSGMRPMAIGSNISRPPEISRCLVIQGFAWSRARSDRPICDRLSPARSLCGSLEMMAYASRTGTKRTVEALKAAGWGWMVGPLDHGRGKLHDMPYALDNGAWPAFAQGIAWNEAAFEIALLKYGPGADFIVAPDVVGKREASLSITRAWLPGMRRKFPDRRILIAVQDGMTFADIEPLLDEQVGIFLGGGTEWKESAIMPWGRWAAQLGLYCHVGRVNTSRRIYLCSQAGAHSFDGTSATRFVINLAKLDGARRQGALL